MKKNLSVLHFIYAIIFCFISMNAQAEVIGDFDYSLMSFNNINTAYLNSLANTSITDAVIPATVTSNGIVYKVTGINSSVFQNNKTLTTITFGQGSEISNIGYGTFYNCSALKSVTNIPNSVTSIESSTFSNCSSLTTVTFEEGSKLTNLNNDSFSNCSKLTDITLPETVTTIEQSAFSGCSALTNIIIPDAVNYIGQSAFSGCSALTNINIPNKVTKIEDYTFQSCSKLASITLSDALTSIGQAAFNGCSALTNIIIPDAVNYIGANAFSYCSALTTIKIPNSVTSIGFESNQWNPKGLFSGCYALTSVTFEEGSKLTNLYDYTFYSCYRLTSIKLPDALTSIGQNVFSGCSALTAINIPNTVTSIGKEAFYGCSNAGIITVPTSVTQIGNNAFGGDVVAVKLSSSKPATITSNIGNMILVPETALETYKSADIWSTLNNICPDKKYEVTVDAAESTSSLLSAIGKDQVGTVFDLKINGSINGYDIMVIRNKMPMLRFLDLGNCTIKGNSYQYYTGCYTRNDTLTGYAFYNTPLYSIVLPKGIKSIEVNAFGTNTTSGNNINNIHHITGMPSSCKNIGESAFANCNKLADIVLGDSVITINNSAFNYCYSLKSIQFSKTLEYIGSNAFSSCSNLKSLSLPNTVKRIEWSAFSDCNSLTDISLSNSLDYIGGSAFRNCNSLTSITIPGSVKTVGDQAFSSCNNLKTIYASTIQPITISQNTFSTYSSATLYVPKTSYELYYWNTQWSQFSPNVIEFEPIIENAYVNGNSDYKLNDKTGTLKGDPNIDMDSNSGLIVEGASTQTTTDLNVSQTSSIIGDNNLTTKELNIKMPINANQWYFFCFPYDFPLSDIKYNGNYVLRYYDGETRAEKGSGGWKDMTGTSIIAGNGYIFQGNKSGTLEIPIKNVTFNKEDKDKTMDTHTSTNKQDASWNFVGNPFTSFYDINSLKLTSPITVWNGTSYEAVSPEDDDYQLMPFQAFFIQKPNDANVVGFEGASQQTKVQVDADKVKRAARRAARRAASTNRREVINLTISGNNGEDRTRVVFNEEKTADYDIACDAAKFMSDATAQIYSLDGKAVKYAINERPVNNGVVNLGYKAVAEGDYEIKAPRMDVPVYLKDNMTGQIIDLSTGGYQFMSEAGTFDNRFTLLSENVATGITSAWTATGITAIGDLGGISISGATGNVDIYSLDGKEEANCGNGFVNLTAGTYLVKYGKASTKVVVK